MKNYEITAVPVLLGLIDVEGSIVAVCEDTRDFITSLTDVKEFAYAVWKQRITRS